MLSQDCPEYHIWKKIIQKANFAGNWHRRSFNHLVPSVYPLWRDFDKFYADVGRRLTYRHELLLIDKKGDYTPDNCGWAVKGAKNIVPISQRKGLPPVEVTTNFDLDFRLCPPSPKRKTNRIRRPKIRSAAELNTRQRLAKYNEIKTQADAVQRLMRQIKNAKKAATDQIPQLEAQLKIALQKQKAQYVTN